MVLAERPDWLLRVGSHGRTMLWEAAYRGWLAMVEWLLDRGAEVDLRDDKGHTPLMTALRSTIKNKGDYSQR